MNPTILITGVRMPPTSTDEGIRLAHPDGGVIVLSSHAHPGEAAGLLDDGTAGRGCLLKVSSRDALAGRQVDITFDADAYTRGCTPPLSVVRALCPSLAGR